MDKSLSSLLNEIKREFSNVFQAAYGEFLDQGHNLSKTRLQALGGKGKRQAQDFSFL